MSPDPAANKIVELDELVVRPGTYFNPQTEVIVIVDDSSSIDQEVFNMEAFEGADWVHISDDVPVDEPALETTLQEFQTHHHPGTGSVSATALEADDDDVDVDVDDPDDDPLEEGPGAKAEEL